MHRNISSWLSVGDGIMSYCTFVLSHIYKISLLEQRKANTCYIKSLESIQNKESGQKFNGTADCKQLTVKLYPRHGCALARHPPGDWQKEPR